MRAHSLWDLTVGFRGTFTLAALSLLLASAALLLVPLLGTYALDVALAGSLAPASTLLAPLAKGFPGHEVLAYLLLSAAALVGVTALAGGFHYLRGRWTALASEGLIRTLRLTLHHQLERLPAPWHDGMDTGDLVQRCSSDVETLRVFFSNDVLEIARALALLLALLPLMFWRNASLAWLSLSLMPLIFLFAVLFFRRVKTVFKVTDEAEAAMTSALQENLTGIRVVRAFSRQPEERQRFAGFNSTFRDHNRRLIDLMGLYWSLSDLLCLSQIGLVLFAGAYQLQQGTLSVGELFAFLTWVSMVIFPLRQFGRILTDAGKASVALTRLKAVLEATTERSAPRAQVPTMPAPSAAPLGLRLEGLTFTYPGARTPALEDLSLTVEPGQTLALLGAPGAGKTTLLRLLLRYYPVPEGSILVGEAGKPLQALETLELPSHRSALALVAQDPFLYGRSLEANLRVGAPDASEGELWTALEDAALASTVRALPEGLATALGERGVTLSGGQRQRLAIARALLRRPALLLLDDALSAVDITTEAHILAALRARQGESTVILTAHRLSTVRHADRIGLLDQGRLVALGTHETLYESAPAYRALAQQQGFAP